GDRGHRAGPLAGPDEHALELAQQGPQQPREDERRDQDEGHAAGGARDAGREAGEQLMDIGRREFHRTHLLVADVDQAERCVRQMPSRAEAAARPATTRSLANSRATGPSTPASSISTVRRSGESGQRKVSAVEASSTTAPPSRPRHWRIARSRVRARRRRPSRRTGGGGSATPGGTSAAGWDRGGGAASTICTTMPCARLGWRNASFHDGSESSRPTTSWPAARARWHALSRSGTLKVT